MKTKRMEIANLTCRSKIGDKELLDVFVDYFLPAMQNQEAPGSKNSETLFYKFIDLNVAKIENELVLYGRFIKCLNIEREQILEGNTLILSYDTMDSAPSSFFVLLLRNHKLLWIKEMARAPLLKDFRAALLKMLNKERLDLIKNYLEKQTSNLFFDKNNIANIERRAYAEYPELEILVTPLGNNIQIQERLSRFKKIYNITLKALKRNNELGSDFSLLAKKMSETQEKMEAKNVTTEIHGDTKNPLKKEVATELIQAVSDGNYEYKIQGIDDKSNKITETSDTLSLSMIINYVTDDIPQNIKNIIQKYLETVNTYNDRIPQQNADVCEQLKEIEQELLK